jgi:hypothetical protein
MPDAELGDLERIIASLDNSGQGRVCFEDFRDNFSVFTAGAAGSDNEEEDDQVRHCYTTIKTNVILIFSDSPIMSAQKQEPSEDSDHNKRGFSPVPEDDLLPDFVDSEGSEAELQEVKFDDDFFTIKPKKTAPKPEIPPTTQELNRARRVLLCSRDVLVLRRFLIRLL